MTVQESGASPASRSPAGRAVRSVDEHVRQWGDRLASASPTLEQWLVAAREAYAGAYMSGVAAVNAVRYDAPPEPDRLLRVDPGHIEHVVEFPMPKFRLSGVVRCGDWDRTTTRFEDTDVFRAYRAHFRGGVPWSETAFFDRVLDEVERGRAPWGCECRADFEERCRRLDRLYESIRTHGFRTQTEVHDGEVPNPIEHSTHPAKRLRDEVAVHVGRDGRLLFEDGRNRLSIAKLLGLDAIPVRVLMRHCDWQATRDDYVAGTLDDPGAVEDHPDVRYLSPGRA